MPGTTTSKNNQVLNTNNSTVVTTANDNLVVDSIKSTTNFTLNNEDSNGIKDATKKSARVIKYSNILLCSILRVSSSFKEVEVLI